MLDTTDWNLQNPDSVFMGSMRIPSISTWAQVSEQHSPEDLELVRQADERPPIEFRRRTVAVIEML